MTPTTPGGPPFALVRVSGRSMEPTLHAGDLLLVTRLGRAVRAGDVVVCDLPADGHGRPRPRAVKRVTGRDPDDPARWWIDSDNPGAGVTSFDPTVGSLADDAVRGRVLLRISRRKGRWGPRRVH
ncbi:S24/S26 family peptidase [Janibacter endophyticus]|uniref:S24/S26 family peptidase n=1 Tax=Janibacter endophyticus TaxID=2806261 RepID=UPI0027DDF72D|nr:S24/S26 family peptidase [Janibacter endophyticus]